jgi:hypothetical protein
MKSLRHLCGLDASKESKRTHGAGLGPLYLQLRKLTASFHRWENRDQNLSPVLSLFLEIIGALEFVHNDTVTAMSKYTSDLGRSFIYIISF